MSNILEQLLYGAASSLREGQKESEEEVNKLTQESEQSGKAIMQFIYNLVNAAKSGWNQQPLENGNTINETVKKQLNPYQEGVSKGLKQMGEKQAIEAVTQGVPPEFIAKKANLGNEQLDNNMPEANQNIPQSQNQTPNIQLPGVVNIKGATSPFAFGGIDIGKDNSITYKQPGFIGNLIRGSNANNEMLQQAGLLQALVGGEPLQRGQKELIGLQNEQELRKMAVQLQAKGMEGLAPEQAGKFGQLLEGREATIEMDEILFGDKGLFGTGGKILQTSLPDFMKSQEGRRYDAALERAIQMKTRAETGAAMEKNELKNAKKRYAPRPGDSAKTIKTRLSPLFDYFNQSIAIADPSGIHSERAKEARKSYSSQRGSLKVKSVREIEEK